jgi:hypothetical protein
MSEPPRYSPLALIGVLVFVLLGFAAFFVSFLIMPMLALVVFYISLASKERLKKDRAPPPGASEHAQAEASARAVLLRREEEARERQAKREATTRARERTLEEGAEMDEAHTPAAERGAGDSTPTGA